MPIDENIPNTQLIAGANIISFHIDHACDYTDDGRAGLDLAFTLLTDELERRGVVVSDFVVVPLS